jgi:hypothetical protein
MQLIKDNELPFDFYGRGLPDWTGSRGSVQIDILAAVKRTAIPHHATFLGWSRQWG